MLSQSWNTALRTSLATLTFQVHLGGGVGLDAGFGRKVRGLKTTATDMPDYVERLVRRFVAARQPGERFAQWVARADEAELL